MSADLILIVDDHDDSREILREFLEGEGFRVETAANGIQALAVLATLEPRALLLDLRMPEMDGWELLQRLRAHPEWRRIPVVLTTAERDVPPGYAVLKKPLRLTAVLTAIGRLIENGKHPRG